MGGHNVRRSIDIPVGRQLNSIPLVLGCPAVTKHCIPDTEWEPENDYRLGVYEDERIKALEERIKLIQQELDTLGKVRAENGEKGEGDPFGSMLKKLSLIHI